MQQLATPATLLVRGRPVRPWLALIALIFGFFMALLDGTIVNIAIPTLQASLKTDLSSISWVLSAYNLVFAVLLVTVGRFADLYGRKRIFMFGMILFTVGSVFCALAQTFGALTDTPAIDWLIGFRALQAIGAAGLTPISLAIIMAIFPREKRGAAIGVWGALGGLASAAGPVIGGFLIENFDWRWIFFVNLPFCVVGVLLVVLFVPETRNMHGSRHIDIPGIMALTVAIFCMVLAIIQSNTWGWSSIPIVVLLSVALLALSTFIVVEKKQKNPIVDFGLFKHVSFTGANLTTFFFGIAIQGAFLILVLYFTNASGYSQLNAAYALLPLPVASFIISVVAGRLSAKINSALMGVGGLVLLCIGFALLYLINADTSYFDIAWRSVLIGVGMGMIFQSQPAIALSDVPPAKLGVGSGVFNTFRQIGFALGVAILVSVFTGNLKTNLDQARSNAIVMVQEHTNLPVQMRQGIITDLNASGNAGNNTTRSIDLTMLANKLPAQMPGQVKAEIRSELRVLSNNIGYAFKTQTVNAFRSSWLVATIFAIAGFISALVAMLVRPAKREEQQQQAAAGVLSVARATSAQQEVAVQSLLTLPIGDRVAPRELQQRHPQEVIMPAAMEESVSFRPPLPLAADGLVDSSVTNGKAVQFQRNGLIKQPGGNAAQFQSNGLIKPGGSKTVQFKGNGLIKQPGSKAVQFKGNGSIKQPGGKAAQFKGNGLIQKSSTTGQTERPAQRRQEQRSSADGWAIPPAVNTQRKQRKMNMHQMQQRKRVTQNQSRKGNRKTI